MDIVMEEDGDDTIYAASEDSDDVGSGSEHDGAVVSRFLFCSYQIHNQRGSQHIDGHACKGCCALTAVQQSA